MEIVCESGIPLDDIVIYKVGSCWELQGLTWKKINGRVVPLY